jgi:hypothetical protein
MKNKIYVYLMFLILYTGTTSAQTVFSNGTGGGLWNDASTWLGGTVPTLTSDVVIAGGDSVSTTVGAVCNNLTIYSGGKVATSVDTVYVAQTITLEADAWFYNATGEPRIPGREFILDPQSYVVHMNGGTVGGGDNLEYGNLIIQRNAGSVPGGSLLIHGDLIINNAAYNTMFRGLRPSSEPNPLKNVNHIVEGNLYINKGNFSGIDVGDPDGSQTCIWNIYGNVYVTDNTGPYDVAPFQESRIGLFSSANAMGYSEINIGGELILNGGRLQGGTSSSAGSGSGAFNIGGNFILDANSNVATNTLGSVTVNFNGTSVQQVNLDNKFQMSTAVYTNINSGADVVFDLDTNKWSSTGGGEFIVNGSLEFVENSFVDGSMSFTVNPGATLRIGSPDGITTTTLGNIRTDAARTFSTEANYEYKGTTAQVTGDALPTTMAGLAVNNPAGLTIDKSHYLITESLNIINGDLDLNGNSVTFSSNALLTETPGNTVKGAEGRIVISTALNAPSGVNPGGFGAMITSSADLGMTTIERLHYTSAGGGKEGISRVYNIMPSNNSGLSAVLRLYYDESELNSIPEENLRIFRSADGSDNPWDNLAGIVNTSENYVEQSGIADFSFWTLADANNPLPVETEENIVPGEFSLYQNYPNPFNPLTVIKFDIPADAAVDLSVYNMLGEKVSVILQEQLSAGRYNVKFDASGLSNGVYLYMLKTDANSIVKKMLLLK